MGKKSKAGFASGGGFSSPPPQAASARGPPPDSAGARPAQMFGRSEPGLCVRRERGGLAYLSGLSFGVVVLLGVSTALAPTLPQLLCHFTWVVLTLFGGALVGCRWAKADEAAAHLIFWALLMVHGLCCLPILLVPFFGVLPGSLWSAYGEHGGDYLAMASLGSVPLLVIPPLATLLLMWFEREVLVVIYHDFVVAMDGSVLHVVFQLLSPLLPLGLWVALLRPPLFSDLPQWPGTLNVICSCVLANAPPIVYAYLSTRQFLGPAHWFHGGAIVWALGGASM